MRIGELGLLVFNFQKPVFMRRPLCNWKWKWRVAELREWMRYKCPGPSDIGRGEFGECKERRYKWTLIRETQISLELYRSDPNDWRDAMESPLMRINCWSIDFTIALRSWNEKCGFLRWIMHRWIFPFPEKLSCCFSTVVKEVAKSISWKSVGCKLKHRS